MVCSCFKSFQTFANTVAGGSATTSEGTAAGLSNARAPQNAGLKASLTATRKVVDELQAVLLEAEKDMEGLEYPPPCVDNRLDATMRSRFEVVAKELHSLSFHARESRRSADNLLVWTQLEPEELDACEAFANRATQESGFGADTSIEDLSVLR